MFLGSQLSDQRRSPSLSFRHQLEAAALPGSCCRITWRVEHNKMEKEKKIEKTKNKPGNFPLEVPFLILQNRTTKILLRGPLVCTHCLRGQARPYWKGQKGNSLWVYRYFELQVLKVLIGTLSFGFFLQSACCVYFSEIRFIYSIQCLWYCKCSFQPLCDYTFQPHSFARCYL